MAADSGQEPANALNTSQSVLQYFWDLASYDEEVRLAAARGLVADVIADQAKHNASLGKDTDAAPEEGAPKQKQLEYHLRRCSPTMVYTLRRLARGLASSRQAARQGYATALAGLLAPSAKTHVTPAGVMVLLEVCVDGPVKGGDAKDTLLARLFGYGALLRSGLPLEAHMLAVLFNGLLEVGARKSFLREAAASVALEAAARMDKAGVAAVAAPGGLLTAMLAAPPAEATPEALLLALVLWPKLPPAAVKVCKLLPAGTPPPPSEVFSSAGGAPAPAGTVAAAAAATAAGLFSKEHVKVLQPVLLATSASHPRLHTLWHYLLPLLLPGFRPYRAAAGGAAAAGHDLDVGAAAAAAAADKKGAAAAAAAAGKGAVSGPLLESFWSCVVEGGLMDSSHERRYLGFQLFARCLPHLRPEHVATVFSPALTRTLTNAVKRRDSYLHASARKLLDGISGFLERSDGGGADGGVKMAVAAALQRLGGMAPKELAAGKLTQKLVQGMDAEGVHSYVTSLMSAFLAAAPPLQPGAAADNNSSSKANGHAASGSDAAAAAGEGEEDAAQSAADRRGQCVEQLLATLRFPAAAEGDAAAALRFLALHAFVAVEAPAKAAKSKVPEVASAGASGALAAQPLTPSTRGVCASRLVTLLAHLSHTAQAALRNSQQQQGQGRKAGEAGADAAADAPSAKKRKTASGAAAADAGGAAAGAGGAASPGSVHAHLHSTLSFLRDKALKAPGVALAKELGEEGESALGLLAAIEAAALERLAPLDAASKGATEDEASGKVAGAGRLRALAALCAHLQLSLLADPEAFEMDLPLSLRRAAAEGLGLEGLPEVEEAEEAEEGGQAKDKEAASWCDVLVDVLLALMARPQGSGPGSLPSAPLREAAEALWRGCCDGLRAEGLQDIVRVVAAGGKGEGQDAAGLYESDEEEEVEEDEEEGSEDEEDEEEEEEEEEKEADKKPAKRKAGSDDDDEEEDEEDEGMDDEAMFRMDDKLAAYFKSMAAGRAGGQAAAERAAALLNFRLRALALLEVYAKKSPNSPLLLAALVPLVRALATAARPGGQPQVAERLKGVIVNKLGRCRCAADVSVLGGLEGYTGALKRLLYEASRNKDRVTAAAALAGYTALLRAGAAAEDGQVADAARSSFRAALRDLLTSKKTRLQPEGLAATFRAAPGACLPAGLEQLLAHVSTADKSRNAHARVAAAELLSRVVRAPPEGLAAALTTGGATGLGGAFGAALAACAAGVGLKREHHGRAAGAAAAAAEALKRLLPAGKRAAEVLGADKLNAVAKAVVTVQSLSAPPKVVKPLKRLAEALALGPLLEKTQADPALASRITKARPDKQQQPPAAAAAAQKPGDKGKKGKEDKKAAAAAKQGGAEKKGQKQEAKKRKAEEEDEEEDDDEEDGTGSGDDDDDEEEVGMSDEDGDEGDSDEDGPSGSGGSDEDDDDDDGDDEDEKPKRGKGGASRGGKAGGGGGRGKGGPRGSKFGGGTGGRGGKGQGRPGGKQGGRGGKVGGSSGKKARR